MRGVYVCVCLVCGLLSFVCLLFVLCACLFVCLRIVFACLMFFVLDVRDCLFMCLFCSGSLSFVVFGLCSFYYDSFLSVFVLLRLCSVFVLCVFACCVCVCMRVLVLFVFALVSLCVFACLCGCGLFLFGLPFCGLSV